jgi:hypothetical protein
MLFQDRRPFVIALSATALCVALGVSAEQALPQHKLLTAADMVYEGSFRLPSQTSGGSRFGYGGHGLTYYAQNNSLFVGGHDWHQLVAEVKVPATLSKSSATQDLPTATFLQPFADVTDGNIRSIVDKGNVTLGGQSGRIGGLLPFGGRLYASYYIYYDGGFQQTRSHFVSSLDLREHGDARGAFKVGDDKPGFFGGYMAIVPEAWRASLGGPALTGNCCLAVIGRTSYGPAVSTFDPATMNDAASNATVPATRLLYYTDKNPLGPWSGQSELYNGTTQVGGVAFPDDTRSVLFIGAHGTGPFCYKCKDVHGNTTGGTYAYPYVYRVWAYDAAKLAEVKRGALKPWDVRPYATWDLTFPQVMPEIKRIVGVGYDSARRRIFVAQSNTESPLIHVFTVTP